MAGLVELAGVWLATFALPWAGAASPLTLPLPTAVNYAQVIHNTVGGTSFSTDVRARVAAEVDATDGDTKVQEAFNSCGFPQQQVLAAVGSPPTCTEKGAAKLEVFITANKECTQQGDVITYRIFVRNVGDAAATDVTWHFEAPAGTTIVDGAADGTLSNIPPGKNQEFYVTVDIVDDIQAAVATVSVGFLDCEQKKANYACSVETWCSCMQSPGASCQELCCEDGVCNATCQAQCLANPSPACVAKARRSCNNSKGAATTHVINGDCSPPPDFPSRDTSGEPVIICDDAETNCQESRPILGPRFPQAQGPVICEPGDPRGCTEFRPQLGPRFAEAIDDIQPGECSVINDAVVITPAYHDAFLRLGAPSAPFMRPLYQNDQDFIRLVHSLELTGIRHVSKVRQELDRLERTHWKEIIQLVQNAGSSGTLLGKYDQITQAWLQELPPLQTDFMELYKEVQTQRKEQFLSVMCGQTPESFDPSTCTAVQQARQAVTAACGVASDGGLSGAITGVRTAYDQQLDARTAAYPGMQLTARNRLSQQLTVEIRAQIAAAGADPIKLQQLLAFLHQQEPVVLDGLVQIYRAHIAGDRQGGTQVRINAWGPAADQPKTAATACIYEIVQPPPVELTWCESGSYQEFIIREAPEPAKAVRPGILPPQLIPGGNQAQINPGEVSGTVCGGAPGDPFWANDCSCHCGEVVRCGNSFTLCELCQNITRHDIYVRHPQDTDAGDQFDRQSQLECLQEGTKHDDPFF